MALKLNIRPDIEAEMDHLIEKIKIRSKTAYINQAIEAYNQKLDRELKLAKLKAHFARRHARS